jgi:hypothetical protein
LFLAHSSHIFLAHSSHIREVVSWPNHTFASEQFIQRSQTLAEVA